jgi:hypothetical protein
MSRGAVAVDGFGIDEEGSIMRTGVAEAEWTTEVTAIDSDLPVELGCGR